MNYLKLFWNNGSVPDPYFYQFKLEFLEDGTVNLILNKGRDSDLETIESESKKVSPQLIAELIEQSKYLSSTKKKGAMVGGPEKHIELNQNEEIRIIIISETNKNSTDFFSKCLQLYDSGLQKRLESIL